MIFPDFIEDLSTNLFGRPKTIWVVSFFISSLLIMIVMVCSVLSIIKIITPSNNPGIVGGQVIIKQVVKDSTKIDSNNFNK